MEVKSIGEDIIACPPCVACECWEITTAQDGCGACRRYPEGVAKYPDDGCFEHRSVDVGVHKRRVGALKVFCADRPEFWEDTYQKLRAGLIVSDGDDRCYTEGERALDNLYDCKSEPLQGGIGGRP